MSVERVLEGWEKVQRQGQDIADRVGALAQGLGCMLQSYLSVSVIPTLLPLQLSEPSFDWQWYEEIMAVPSSYSWPWLTASSKSMRGGVNRVQFNRAKPHPSELAMQSKPWVDDGAAAIQELDLRLGEIGAAVGVCVASFMNSAASYIPWPFRRDNAVGIISGFAHSGHLSSLEFNVDRPTWKKSEEQADLVEGTGSPTGDFQGDEDDLEEMIDLEEDYEGVTDPSGSSMSSSMLS